jgi:hypothetical protein
MAGHGAETFFCCERFVDRDVMIGDLHDCCLLPDGMGRRIAWAGSGDRSFVG